jgi:predicted transcriptional regulator
MSGCGCACNTKEAGGESKQVLEALAKCAGPCGSKDIAEATGLDKKVISNQIAALKKQGLVDSPVRCKYGITAEGKASLG